MWDLKWRAPKLLNTASTSWVGGNDVGAVWWWGQEKSLEIRSFSYCIKLWQLKPNTIKLEKQVSVLWFNYPKWMPLKFFPHADLLTCLCRTSSESIMYSERGLVVWHIVINFCPIKDCRTWPVIRTRQSVVHRVGKLLVKGSGYEAMLQWYGSCQRLLSWVALKSCPQTLPEGAWIISPVRWGWLLGSEDRSGLTSSRACLYAEDLALYSLLCFLENWAAGLLVSFPKKIPKINPWKAGMRRSPCFTGRAGMEGRWRAHALLTIQELTQAG